MAFGNFAKSEKEHGVSFFGHVAVGAMALAEASNHVSARVDPTFAVAALSEFTALANLTSVRINSIAMEAQWSHSVSAGLVVQVCADIP